MPRGDRFFYFIGAVGEQEYFRYCQGVDLELLDLHGRGYAVEYCASAYLRDMEQRRYRAYVTDALMVISESLARLNGGRAMAGRWADGFKKADTRTGDEIALEVIRRLEACYAGGGEGHESVFAGGDA